MKSGSKNGSGVLIFTHAAGNSEVGPNARWARFAEGLLRFNVETTVVGASFFHKYQKAIPVRLFKPRTTYVDGASFVHLWSPRYSGSFGRLLNQLSFSVGIFLLSRARFFEKKIDIVIASSPHPFVVLGALYWAKRLKAKFVFESRDLWPELLIQHLNMSQLHPYVLLSDVLERIAVKHSKFIITPKESESLYYSEVYGNSNVVWIPNTSKRVTYTKSREMSNGLVSIIYSGSLQSIYKVDELILAVRSIQDPRISLKILGDGPELEALKALAYSDARIVFSGWLVGGDYDCALRAADICYFSTADMSINRYGFSSNKVSDYLSRGKPILAHVSTGAECLVQSGACLQSNPGDIQQLAENIQRFLNEKDLIDKASEASLAYYLDFYEYDNVVEKLAKLILD